MQGTFLSNSKAIGSVYENPLQRHIEWGNLRGVFTKIWNPVRLSPLTTALQYSPWGSSQSLGKKQSQGMGIGKEETKSSLRAVTLLFISENRRLY